MSQGQEAGKSKRSFKSIGVDPMLDSVEAPSDWPLEFGRLQKMIIGLWQTCHISLIHRTYFLLLFKGDQMDSIYMEVEVRRLSFLKEILSNGNSAVQGGQTITLASRYILYPAFLIFLFPSHFLVCMRLLCIQTSLVY